MRYKSSSTISDRRTARQAVPRSRGFTIIELMVVVGIILILVALLLPAMNGVLNTERRLLCQSNLHQMGVAINAYVADHDYYPGHCAWCSGGFPVAVWPVRLRPYFTGQQKIFYCPARDDVFQWYLITGTPGGYYATQSDVGLGYELGELMLAVNTFHSTYGYNDWGTIGAGNAGDGHQKGLGGDLYRFWSPFVIHELPRAQVKNPPQMIAIADNLTRPDGSWDYNLDPTNPGEYIGNIHDNGCNVLFCDGHVAWYLQKSITNWRAGTPESNQVNRMWNNDNQVWR